MLVSMFFSFVAPDTTFENTLLTGSDLASICLKYISIVNRNTDGTNVRLKVMKGFNDYYIAGITNIPVTYGYQSELNYVLKQYDKLSILFDAIAAGDIIDVILTVKYNKD
ncbi:MAG: hypothetical protein AELANPGJ_03598 [Anaerolineae bacterium]|nr:hypothetical protein [Anaerolineae bacterium]